MLRLDPIYFCTISRFYRFILRPDATLELLQQLHSVTVAEHDEVLSFIGARELHGRGIGYVDAHLLAAAAIEGCQLWTRDKRLHALAATLGIAVN